MLDQQKIGLFIQAQRKAHGLTQKELAERLGVTNKAVSKWELGRSLPDVALFEPLCRELEISIPELLAGHAIREEEKQRATEELLVESISMRELVGLSLLLQVNSLVGVLLVTSPFLFHAERPLNILLVVFGLAECALAAYFDYTLPGREARRESLTVRFVYTICLFVSIGVINYPASVRENVPLATEILIFLIPCLICLLGQYLFWRWKR